MWPTGFSVTFFDFPGDSRDFPVGTSLSSTQIISRVAPSITGTTRNSTKEARPLIPRAGQATTATARTGDGTTTRSTHPTTKKRTETPKRLRIWKLRTALRAQRTSPQRHPGAPRPWRSSPSRAPLSQRPRGKTASTSALGTDPRSTCFSLLKTGWGGD